MQFVTYLNHPLRTISAKESDRLMVERAMASLGAVEWRAPELKSVPLPPRKHPQPKARPATRRARRLRTDDVLARIPIDDLAELLDLAPKGIASWGYYVPPTREAWLQRLLENWETVETILSGLRQGSSRFAIAKSLKSHPDTLDLLCAEFGISQWLAQTDK